MIKGMSFVIFLPYTEQIITTAKVTRPQIMQTYGEATEAPSTFSPPDVLGTMTMSSAGVHYFIFSFVDSLAGLTSNHSLNVGFL